MFVRQAYFAQQQRPRSWKRPRTFFGMGGGDRGWLSVRRADCGLASNPSLSSSSIASISLASPTLFLSFFLFFLFHTQSTLWLRFLCAGKPSLPKSFLRLPNLFVISCLLGSGEPAFCNFSFTTLLNLCVSPLCKSHAILLCIFPI